MIDGIRMNAAGIARNEANGVDAWIDESMGRIGGGAGSGIAKVP